MRFFAGELKLAKSLPVSMRDKRIAASAARRIRKIAPQVGAETIRRVGRCSGKGVSLSFWRLIVSSQEPDSGAIALVAGNL
jgi:hypothetical protein